MDLAHADSLLYRQRFNILQKIHKVFILQISDLGAH
jgi:hypothetical protein